MGRARGEGANTLERPRKVTLQHCDGRRLVQVGVVPELAQFVGTPAARGGIVQESAREISSGINGSCIRDAGHDDGRCAERQRRVAELVGRIVAPAGHGAICEQYTSMGAAARKGGRGANACYLGYRARDCSIAAELARIVVPDALHGAAAEESAGVKGTIAHGSGSDSGEHGIRRVACNVQTRVGVHVEGSRALHRALVDDHTRARGTRIEHGCRAHVFYDDGSQAIRRAAVAELAVTVAAPAANETVFE